MNSITLAKKFIPLLDESYRLASVTSVLDGNAELVRQGANANELIIPIMSLQGLGDYDRNSGYVQGDVTLTNETVTCNFDRGRMFTVDSTDNLETAGVAFGYLAGEFIRTKVVPRAGCLPSCLLRLQNRRQLRHRHPDRRRRRGFRHSQGSDQAG